MAKVIERSERKEYGERILHIRDGIYKRITKVPSFLKIVREKFKAYHFNNFDRNLKQSFDELIDANNIPEAHVICLKLSPKFSKIFYFFEERENYEDTELSSLIDEFYILANVYFESYRNLIHKLIHDNPQASFLNYMDVFSDSYQIVLYTLSLYDYRIAEFGTVLGKNMHHMIRTCVKSINEKNEVSIDCVPQSLLKDHTRFDNTEEVISSLVEENFVKDTEEYIVGKMIMCDNHDITDVAKALNKPNAAIVSIKKTIIKKLKNNPKAMAIINEIVNK